MTFVTLGTKSVDMVMTAESGLCKGIQWRNIPRISVSHVCSLWTSLLRFKLNFQLGESVDE